MSCVFSATDQVRSGTPRTSTGFEGTIGPTASATRYEEIGGVSENDTIRRPPFVSSETALPFASTSLPAGASTVSAQRALNAGSSKQGNTRRASAASNWVTASGPAA